MSSKTLSEKAVGVVGAGSFGSVIANMLAVNRKVILYARDKQVVKRIREEQQHKGFIIHPNVEPTFDMAYLAANCDVIFPIVSSSGFRNMIKKLAPHLHPYHIVIHGTKGLDLRLPEGETLQSVKKLYRHQIKTMSEVIREESVAVRIGCLAGPNLARELADQQPAATVVASHFNEVIQTGQKLLRSDRFQVYGNNELEGVELAGVLKNIIAIAAGALSGLGYGENARGLLISRGIVEIIHIGKAFGLTAKAFLGIAGIGDLVATCSSTTSRNFTVGYRLAKGETLQEILQDMEEVAEGVNTVQIVKKFTDTYKVRALITETVYKVLFEKLTVKEALQYLMRYPLNIDINFID
ncbi:MAG TPA: NAD(P)H-dependent glycerol-3-phosphate dehydrogenase [Cyclobacteriaceae bacterium]|nr:NAD(P)H-dependent glycerol-3-phosphate dehydrogenase [Cyclobacteriaceae bacterium]